MRLLFHRCEKTCRGCYVFWRDGGPTLLPEQDPSMFVNCTLSDLWNFVGSNLQKTWLQAMQFCSARKTKLLDLTFIGELKNPKNAMFFVPKMVNWARLYRTGIWTSGRYLRSVEDGQFRWETTLEMFKNDDKSINFTWAPGEPSDSTKRRLEICIELVLEPWASSKAGDAMLPMLKAANCKLPNYFVCYEDAPRNCLVFKIYFHFQKNCYLRVV